MSGNLSDHWRWRGFEVAFGGATPEEDESLDMYPEDFTPDCTDSEEIVEAWLQRRAEREGEMLNYWLERTNTVCR